MPLRTNWSEDNCPIARAADVFKCTVADGRVPEEHCPSSLVAGVRYILDGAIADRHGAVCSDGFADASAFAVERKISEREREAGRDEEPGAAVSRSPRVLPLHDRCNGTACAGDRDVLIYNNLSRFDVRAFAYGYRIAIRCSSYRGPDVWLIIWYIYDTS